MAQSQPGRRQRILVLNPNSSTSMTEGMVNAAQQLSLQDSIEIRGYTAPSPAPASINEQHDIDSSTAVVLEDETLKKELNSGRYDAVLVACFSVHPLVSQLCTYEGLAVTGILEASITTALSLNPSPLHNEKWGIVTTGKFWEDHLGSGVKGFFGQDIKSENDRFAGVYSTGLNASDFHTVPPEQVQARLQDAARKLFSSGNVSCVVMGCGGMAGLEDTIRKTAVKEYGKAGEQVYIIDGVKAGILQLEQTIRSRKAFR
ncbi:Asp/Glu/hydantoin racemase [Mariannaea sp. PMI_226]|nr:Asp/Glu/hydantoin racemase [Mariannaea sp. PMI_226]